MSFAQSPYDMIAYDDNAEYDAPTDGTTLPQLLPVDDEPGMIRINVISSVKYNYCQRRLRYLTFISQFNQLY